MIVELRLPKCSYDDATTYVTTGGRSFVTYDAGVQGLREEAKRSPRTDLELRTLEGCLAARSAMFDLTPVVIEMAGFGPAVPPADHDDI